MNAVTRAATRPARRLNAQLQSQSRRHASHGHDKHHAAPVNESFGISFYLAIGAIPFSWALYKLTRHDGDENPYFTRLIKDTYESYKATWVDRNDIHTHAMERAAADRVLFFNESDRNVRQVDLRFPEQFNVGSPWNVPAGHGSANLDELIAKYKKESYESQEEKLQQLRENRVPAEQPVKSFREIIREAKDS